jgi:hypothetical protein
VRGFIFHTLQRKLLRIIKASRMRWQRHASSMKEIKNAHKILVEKSDLKGYLGDLSVDGSLILKCILKKYV